MTLKVKVSQLGSKHTQGVRRSCNRSQILGTNGGGGMCYLCYALSNNNTTLNKDNDWIFYYNNTGGEPLDWSIK